MTRLFAKLRILIFLIFIGWIFSPDVWAISLATYQKKIKDTRESVGYLLYPEEFLSEKENLQSQQEIIKEIKSLLKENESVELTGASFEVNHSWLFEKLKEFENEPYDSNQRSPILNEILEKLSALESKLAELEKQEQSKFSKDETKQKLDQILRRSEFQKPVEKQETFLQKKWREFLEWLEKKFPKPNVNPNDLSDGIKPVSTVLQIVLYALIIGLIGFILYRFLPFFLQKYKGKKPKEKKTRVILGETISAEATSQNIFAEAEKLAQEGNLRSAIRKGYIALLCELSDKKIIGLARHKTNLDYLRDVKKHKELYPKVIKLTGSFEKNWYGLKAANEQDWEEFRQTYQQTITK